ncbi:hypothetical protein ES332_A11G270000v1 [Gossypium tomentosum]|uniref:Arabinogalactan peptide 13 n=1 Tax=Gossypium tomentosum TaxID=34277 RepID=A0A5D2NH73_GOSTO|nr:hypothetical protein ES332_A11G270000v1 [Gossypium tomentosum]
MAPPPINACLNFRFLTFATKFTEILHQQMEVLRMRLFLAMMVVLMAMSAVQYVAAADATAPTPTSDATAFVPTAFASLVALAFGLLF